MGNIHLSWPKNRIYGLWRRKEGFYRYIQISNRGLIEAPCFMPYLIVKLLIHSLPAQITNPCQFRNVQHPLLICRIVPEKHARQILNRNLLPPNPLPLGPCVRHSRPHPHLYPRHPQLTEHPGHLQERLAYRVRLAAAATRGDIAIITVI